MHQNRRLFCLKTQSRLRARSAGEHLHVHLLLILPFGLFHPAIDAAPNHPLARQQPPPPPPTPNVSAHRLEGKCRPPEESEGERGRETTLYVSLSPDWTLSLTINTPPHSQPGRNRRRRQKPRCRPASYRAKKHICVCVRFRHPVTPSPKF